MIAINRLRYGLSERLLIALVASLLLFAIPQARAQDCTNNFGDAGIVWTGAGNSVGIVASNNIGGVGGNLYYFWQKGGTINWNRELVASSPNGACPTGCASGWCVYMPWGWVSNAIAWTDNSLVIAAVNMGDGGIYYFWQAADTNTWHQGTVAAGPPNCCEYDHIINGVNYPKILGYSPPSIAWTGRSAVIAACDQQTGDLHYWYQNKDQTPWHHQLVDKSNNNVGCYSQPSIAWAGTTVVIAAVCNTGGTSSGLCYYWQLAGTDTWNHQVVSQYACPPSIAWTGQAVVIAACGPPDYWWQEVGTAPWYSQQILTPQGGNSYIGSAIAAAGNSVVLVGSEVPQVEGTAQLDYAWAQSPSPQQIINVPDQPPASIGGGVSSTPVSGAVWTEQNPGPANYYGTVDQRSIAWTGNSVIFVSVTLCGDLDYFWQQAGTTPWHQERIVRNPDWSPGTCD